MFLNFLQQLWYIRVTLADGLTICSSKAYGIFFLHENLILRIFLNIWS